MQGPLCCVCLPYPSRPPLAQRVVPTQQCTLHQAHREDQPPLVLPCEPKLSCTHLKRTHLKYTYEYD